MSPIVLLFVGMVIVIGGILALRLHAFLALILGAYAVAMLTPTDALRDYAQQRLAKGDMAAKVAKDFADKPAASRVADEFGKTCASIGILIAMASIIGECLLVSGGAESIAQATLRCTGIERAQWAFFFTSYLLGIPVFLATLFCLLLPLAKAMTRRTGRDYLLYILCIIAGGTITHSLVPPAPGPLFVAGALGVGLPAMIGVGSLIGFGAALCGYVFARFACRRLTLVPEADDAPPTDAPARVLPPLWASLIPVLLPLLLIGLQGVFAPPKGAGETTGAADMPLTFGALAGLLLVVWQRPPGGTLKAVQTALAHGALILLITAGGGAFGGALQQTGIAEAIGQIVGGAHTLALPAVFLVTALVRTAQGSATVAMITAVPIAKAFLDSGHTGVAAVYFAVVIGCGSKPIPWMNDAGFWAVARMSGMTETQTLRTMSPMMSLQGVAGLVLTMLAAWLFPLS